MFVEVKVRFFPRIRRALARGGDNLMRMLADPEVRQRLAELDAQVLMSNNPVAKAVLQGLNEGAKVLETHGPRRDDGSERLPSAACSGCSAFLGEEEARSLIDSSPEFREALDKLREKAADRGPEFYRAFAAGWLATGSEEARLKGWAEGFRTGVRFRDEHPEVYEQVMAETGDNRWTTDMIFRAADIAANGTSQPSPSGDVRETRMVDEIRDALGSYDAGASFEARSEAVERMILAIKDSGWLQAIFLKHGALDDGVALLDKPIPAPVSLGNVERQRDGSLAIVSLSSSDILFKLGCQVGDVILSMDGISASRLPDDMIPRLTCSRVIISRMGELVGLPDAEFGKHPNPDIRAQRDGELMDVAMTGIRQDPNAFITHNRNAGPPPTAREGMAQPADFNIAPTATA